jgi:nucleobase:cation symporter-1, NCS1 family
MATTEETGKSSIVDEGTGDRAFRIEQRGINCAPDAARHGRARDLFAVWFAGNITILGIPIGAVLVSFGLTLKEALIADVIGCASFFLVGLAAIPGARVGTATLALSRAPFGLRGNKAPSFLSWMTLVGWETITLIIGTYALEQLLEKTGLHASTGLVLFCLLITAIATFGITLLGHQTVVVMQKAATYTFGIIGAVVVGFLISHYHAVKAPSPVTGNIVTSWVLALSVMFASTVFAWINYAADYTRYLPRQTSWKSIVWWNGIGAFIPGSILIGTGILVGSQVGLASAANPIAALVTLVPTYMSVPLLLVAVVGVLTSNFLNSYSSGLSLQALGIKISRPKTILVDATLSIGAALYAILVANFVSTFTSFLSLEVIWIASWSAIYMVDAWDRLSLRKQGYSGADLFRVRSGQYWYRNGVNWAAVACWVVGSLGAFLFTNSTLWASPLTKWWLGGADISVFVGLVLTGALYLAVLRYLRPSSTEAMASA